MNVERLQHFVNLLRADAANPKGAKFDLGSWAGWERNGLQSHNFPVKEGFLDDRHVLDREKAASAKVEDVIEHVPTMSCNTFVCGLGLAALDPEFNRQGLTFKVCGGSMLDTAWMIPEFNGSQGMEAGAEFFDISVDDSKYFFEPDCYDTVPKEAEGELLVAQRVEDFINGIVDHNHHPDGEYDDRD